MPINFNSNTVDSRGNTQIVIQDQFQPSIDFRLAKTPGITTVAAANSIEDRSITLTDASAAVVGFFCVIARGELGKTQQLYIGEIQSIAVNTLTLDTPLNYEFQIGDDVLIRDFHIEDANGSVTPQVYDIPVPADATNQLDITRIIIAIECATEPDDSKFGDLAALTNGVVLRHNSVEKGIINLWNAKTNGDLAELAYDVLYTDKAGGGAYGVRCLITYNAQQYHGVTIRMKPGDKIEMVVQDDLTGLNKFHVLVQGHVVD